MLFTKSSQQTEKRKEFFYKVGKKYAIYRGANELLQAVLSSVCTAVVTLIIIYEFSSVYSEELIVVSPISK